MSDSGGGIGRALGKSFPVGDMPAHDLFPEIISSEEIDRRIMHSEQRIKFWIMAGVASNLIVAIMAAIPAIFYIGQISSTIEESTASLQKIESAQDQNLAWVQSRMVWEARVEEALNKRGEPIERDK